MVVARPLRAHSKQALNYTKEKIAVMAKVSYDHSGSYRKQSGSSYRSYSSSREVTETTEFHSDTSRYKQSTKYRDFDDIALKDNHSRSSSRRESESRENRGYRGRERDEYPPYRTRQSFTEENVQLMQPGRGKPRTASSLGETDSVRTTASRIPMGLEILQNVDTFVIRQNADSKATWWDIARFQVDDGRGKRIFEVKQEKADNNCVQAVCGKMREYFMKVYVGNQWVMEFEHPWSFLSPIFCPWASPSLITRMPTGEVLGEVRNASRETCATCLPPTKYFEIVNYEGCINHAVTGPTCYPFECSSGDSAVFELLKVDRQSEKTLRIGQINHVWRGICGGISNCCVTEDLETVSITFPKECEIDEKALFLALGFLVLFTFFDFK